MLKYLVFIWGVVAANSCFAAAEAWYTVWGLGGSTVTYGGDAEDAIKSLKDNGGFERKFTSSLDLLGFYWPAFSATTITGVMLNNITDGYESKDFLGLGDTTEMAIRLTQLSWSTMHFWGGEPGDGFFVRGDLGVTSSSIRFTNDSDSFESRSDDGLGLIIGGGYGITISDESRILITLLLGNYKDDESNAKFSSLLVSGMW